MLTTPGVIELSADADLESLMPRPAPRVAGSEGPCAEGDVVEVLADFEALERDLQSAFRLLAR